MNELVKQLSGRRCFVLAKLVPRPNGKVDKIPVDDTLTACSAQDPKNWLTGEEAYDLSQALGCGMGVVISEGSGLFCVDIDGAVVEGAWTPLAADLIGRFPGAYLELSQSQRGGHIIGTTTPVPEHRSKNVAIHVECYTRARFIYLGTYLGGDARTDHSLALAALIAEHFGPSDTSVTDWTDEAQGGDPIDDDQQLLMMLANVRSASVFRGGVTFSQLWNGDEAALAQAFPPNDAATYDRSSADMSLAQRLAWATGSNCERVLNIMRQCPGLTRDKWTREDYLPRTIMRACAQQKEWYRRTKAAATAPPIAAPAPPPSTASDGSPAVPPPPPVPLTLESRMILSSDQDKFFEGWTYITDANAIMIDDGRILGKDKLDNLKGGYQFVHSAEGKLIDSAFEAFVSSPYKHHPKVASTCFVPAMEYGQIRENDLGYTEINLYRPIVTKREKGDIAPFIDFMSKLIPDARDRELYLAYMGACVQNVGSKFMWCPLMVGVQGNGKSTIGDILEFCLGQVYTHRAKSEEMHEKFNSVFVTKLLVVLDEVHSDDRAQLQDILKSFVTAPRLEVRPMYGEKAMKDICFNLLLFSNNPDGIRMSREERRYAPFFCPQQAEEDLDATGMTKQYFVELRKWLHDPANGRTQDRTPGNYRNTGLAIINEYLHTLAIPDDMNPAVDSVRAPLTTSTAVAIRASLGAVEQEVYEAIESGRPGFRNGWVSGAMLDALLNQLRKGGAIRRYARPAMLKKLGYIPHPSAPRVQVAMGLPLDELFIQEGHPLAKTGLSVLQVVQAYQTAQLANPGMPAPPSA